MNSLLKNSRSNRKKERKSLVTSVVVAFVLLVLIFSSHIPFLGGIVGALGKPFWSIGQGTGAMFGDFGTYLSSKASLQADNAQLEEQIASMQADELVAQSALAQNQELKDTFGRTDKTDLVAAGILRSPGLSPYDTFTLDAGQSLGIVQGDKVYADGILPVGYIADVYAHTSIARLYSASGEQVDVIVHTATTTAAAYGASIHATAEGLGGGNFEIQVPQGISIPIGSNVLLPGIAGEVLGVIQDSETDIAHSLQTLRFQDSINVQTLDNVYIERAQTQ